VVTNTSSALMPLGFGAVGLSLGARGLFWGMALVVAGGSLVARSLRERGEAGMSEGG
jgi:hypothetical protein